MKGTITNIMDLKPNVRCDEEQIDTSGMQQGYQFARSMIGQRLNAAKKNLGAFASGHITAAAVVETNSNVVRRRRVHPCSISPRRQFTRRL